MTYAVTIRDAIIELVPEFPPADGHAPMTRTHYLVRLVGDSPRARYRRVYASVYGASITYYVIVDDRPLLLTREELESALLASPSNPYV